MNHSNAPHRSTTNRIVTHPTLATILFLGFGTAIIFALNRWFPHVLEAWTLHDAAVRGTWYTISVFAVLVAYSWKWHRRLAFWTLVAATLAVHVMVVWIYIVYVGPLTFRGWFIVFCGDSGVFVFVIDKLLHIEPAD